MRVVIHASLDHVDALRDAQQRLEQFGCQVRLPDLQRYQHIRDVLGERERFTEIKRRLQRENARNVAESDVLVIVNPDHRGHRHYVGGNSFFEMSIAFYLGKPILLTRPVPLTLPYSEEIEAFGPVVIGDLTELSEEAWARAVAAGLR